MSDITEFVGFSKIPRYESETFTITEKIDGTNACIIINEQRELACQSRTQFITPGKSTDNHGFAGWAYINREQLIAELGPGRHYGEWWGSGINRKYGMAGKHFSLFNVHRWPPERLIDVDGVAVEGVPIMIGEAPLADLFDAVSECHAFLKEKGSFAAPGFMNPEGCMVYFHRLKTYLKAPLVPLPKGLVL